MMHRKVEKNSSRVTVSSAISACDIFCDFFVCAQ